MFDFTELSKRSLGQNWNKFNPDQQKEFIKLYKSLLEDTYADKITSYTDEKLVFGKEISLSEKTVEVQTTVVTKTSEVPINYRVIEENGHWKVYDVVIEGVSLISNYRTQFREILASKTPEALLETLRKKVGKGQVRPMNHWERRNPMNPIRLTLLLLLLFWLTPCAPLPSPSSPGLDPSPIQEEEKTPDRRSWIRFRTRNLYLLLHNKKEQRKRRLRKEDPTDKRASTPKRKKKRCKKYLILFAHSITPCSNSMISSTSGS